MGGSLGVDSRGWGRSSVRRTLRGSGHRVDHRGQRIYADPDMDGLDMSKDHLVRVSGLSFRCENGGESVELPTTSVKFAEILTGANLT